MARVYLSLGSNLQPHRHLRACLADLRAKFGENIAVSPVYRCPAIGFDGLDFINLAVGLDTELSPESLNDWLHALEDRHGRRRDVPRFSDRTLDVDIVLYGALVRVGPNNLQLPREELKHAFVLKPLVDIAADTRHPVHGKTLGELWAAFPQDREALYPDSL